ncbi:hypothetical protein cand_022830 [Cryptosporidium andersoni]|uniref:Uncharacterized protein n=1 Tax=Cryptosporidium andersoni TaxID=117008 RepID=A0A1J4MV60_9CRYT|nr:hypothetical protein cand_022830 [Cryptosporidium andersoni]
MSSRSLEKISGIDENLCVLSEAVRNLEKEIRKKNQLNESNTAVSINTIYKDMMDKNSYESNAEPVSNVTCPEIHLNEYGGIKSDELIVNVNQINNQQYEIQQTNNNSCVNKLFNENYLNKSCVDQSIPNYVIEFTETRELNRPEINKFTPQRILDPIHSKDILYSTPVTKTNISNSLYEGCFQSPYYQTISDMRYNSQIVTPITANIPFNQVNMIYYQPNYLALGSPIPYVYSPPVKSCPQILGSSMQSPTSLIPPNYTDINPISINGVNSIQTSSMAPMVVTPTISPIPNLNPTTIPVMQNSVSDFKTAKKSPILPAESPILAQYLLTAMAEECIQKKNSFKQPCEVERIHYFRPEPKIDFNNPVRFSSDVFKRKCRFLKHNIGHSNIINKDNSDKVENQIPIEQTVSQPSQPSSCVTFKASIPINIKPDDPFSDAIGKVIRSKIETSQFKNNQMLFTNSIPCVIPPNNTVYANTTNGLSTNIHSY